MLNVEIKCMGETLHKEEGDITITNEDCKCKIKTVKMFLTTLFGNHRYSSSYISYVSNMYFVYLPPEFYVDIPSGYFWG